MGKETVDSFESEKGKGTEPSPSFDMAIERKLSGAYNQGYSDGARFVWVSFIMALIMLVVMRRFLDGSI
jgi:hypothetical protein